MLRILPFSFSINCQFGDVFSSATRRTVMCLISPVSGAKISQQIPTDLTLSRPKCEKRDLGVISNTQSKVGDKKTLSADSIRFVSRHSAERQVYILKYIRNKCVNYSTPLHRSDTMLDHSVKRNLYMDKIIEVVIVIIHHCF